MNYPKNSIGCLFEAVFLDETSSDDESLDFGRPFIDLCDSRVSVVTLGRHVCHVAHTTEDLDTLMSAESGRFGGCEFGHRCFLQLVNNRFSCGS